MEVDDLYLREVELVFDYVTNNNHQDIDVHRMTFVRTVVLYHVRDIEFDFVEKSDRKNLFSCRI